MIRMIRMIMKLNSSNINKILRIKLKPKDKGKL